jgi:hypothetical protein
MKKKNLKEIASIIIHLGCIIFVIVFAFEFSGCALPDLGSFVKDTGTTKTTETTTTQQQITWSADQLTLQWDPPAETVANYDVFYRVHGSSGWNSLGEITAVSSPEYVVQHSTLGNGVFDFAVVAKNAEGDTSDYHTSLDSTADPSTGWYVTWQM